MLPEDQKRILGYFIEEAKDHLNTIEQGLLNLGATVNDSEMMNEVFRAAHSVKGGAAMLGLNSIQRTSHRMEDFFKIMKESPLRPDRDLESMLLQIFDGLQEQLEQLQSPFGLTEDQAQEILTPLEPIFDQAEAHLEALVAAAPAAAPAPAPAPRPTTVMAAAAHPETSALQLVFRSDVPALLRDMLSTFKQPDAPTSRRALGQLCQRLRSIGEQFELSEWCSLIQAVDGAIANPAQTYRTLAPIVIKDLKQAQDQVMAGSVSQVNASPALAALLPIPAADLGPAISDDSTLDALLAEALNDDSTEPDLADLFAAAEAGDSDDLGMANAADWLDQLDLDEPDNITDAGLDALFDTVDTELSQGPALPSSPSQGNIGPEVGAAELNSLADLFESAPNGLTDIWEEENLAEISFADLGLGDKSDDADDEAADLETEFADLLATDAPPVSAQDQAIDDMATLFGYDLDESPTPPPAALDWLESEPTRSNPGASAAAPADFLDDLPAEPPASPPSRPPLDNFFEFDDESESLAADGSALADVDSFFAAAEADLNQSDDAHTLPELNLDFDEVVDNAPAPITPSTPESFFADADADAFSTDNSNIDEFSSGGVNLDDDIDLFGSDSSPIDNSLADDPFGDLVLEDSPFDSAFEAAFTAPSPPESTEPANLETADLEVADLDIDDALESATPEEWAAPDHQGNVTESMALETADFGALDSLLEDSVTDDPFDFDEPTPPLAPTPENADTQPGFDSSWESGSIFNGTETEGPGLYDDGAFDDLEALLDADSLADEQPPSGIDHALSSNGNGAGDHSAATSWPGNAASVEAGDDEFGDLEKLLEEADQLGGSAPTLASRRGAAAPSARRSPRRASSTTDQTMRVSVGHLDTLSNLVGELVVNRNSLEQDQERLRQFLDNLLHQVSQLNDVGQRMRDLYERSLLESSLIANRQAFALGVSSQPSSSSHATGATFDALEMDRFTGFHTLSQEMIELIVRVREASSDIEFTIDSTDQIARQFRQVTTQLQEGLNKARMVPFGQTADRLPRAVRDISLKCGKEAKLVVEGRDTLIDKMILERLYDPMTHLVNNAITHGIESPEERLATGKTTEGTITVRAFYQGNQTVIYIADDGGGINPAVVKAKALKQGLITPAEAQSMTEIEVYDLLFLPGFSTRDQADDFSGRGVGMDVVRTALADIRGSITIESEVGKGTSFTIRLPLTLSITKALSCVNNQARIAFPMDGVEDMFDVPKERIQTDDQGHSCILWRDTLLPFRPLAELLRFNRTLGRGRVYGGPQDEDVVSMVVLRSASTFIALQVDQVIGEQEIVIKQLEGPVPKPIGIAGATVLGDGRVMPIADVLELIDLASGRLRRDSSTSLWTQTVDEEPVEVVDQTDPTVLIVDDSITVRELLSMSFNKVGYRVEQARDGQEAWEKLRSGLPCDLVFCDIEMPRMDGLELLSRMQKDSALSQIPIAMLTSRGADRHRQMAVDLGARGYFTKPYLEEMLLDAAQRMLKGENMIPKKAE